MENASASMPLLMVMLEVKLLLQHSFKSLLMPKGFTVIYSPVEVILMGSKKRELLSHQRKARSNCFGIPTKMPESILLTLITLKHTSQEQRLEILLKQMPC